MKTILSLFLLAATQLFGATTYYIDYTGGSDSNAGTNSSAPWKRHPYMNGGPTNYTHAAGDRFIFKGGVTWPAATFPMTIPHGYGGTAANPDYYGVDSSWPSSSWSQPVFDAGGTAVATFIEINAGCVTVDNIIFTGQKITTAQATGATQFIALMPGGSYDADLTNVMICSCLFTNWSHEAGANDNNKRGIYGHGGIPGTGNVISNCVFDGRPNGTNCVMAVQAPVEKVTKCRVGYMSNGLLPNPSSSDLEISYNVVGPIFESMTTDGTVHENSIEPEGSAKLYCHNNVIFNPTAAMFLTTSAHTEYWFYNNLLTNNLGVIPVVWDSASQYPTTGAPVHMWNNTIISDTACVRWERRDEDVNFTHVDSQNNHFITDYGDPFYFSPNASAYDSITSDHNLTQTVAQATSAGYTPDNQYQPTSGSSPTYHAGTNAPSSVFTTDLLGVSRGSTWDIGAYQYSEGEPTAPTITMQPTSQRVLTNTAANFSVTATGDPTLTYQWSMAGTNVTGAVSYTWSYTPTVAGTNNVFCGVTNSVGGVVSDTVTLAATNGVPAGNGTNWYVDATATGAGTGTSWTNAWTTMGAVVWGESGVKAGDTLYLSGGTYTSAWTVGASGTAGNPITIAPSAEAGHDGLVIFDFTATGTNSSTTAVTCQQDYVTFAGAVTNACHLVVRNLVNTVNRYTAIAFDCTGADNVIFDHVAATNVNSGIDFQSSSGAGVVVRYCNLAQVRGDRAIAIVDGTAAWDTALIYSNNIECLYNETAPAGYSGYYGPDPIWSGSGVTMFGNRIWYTPTSLYTSSQHPDTVQCTGDYVKFYGNTVLDGAASGFDYDCYAHPTPHDIWIYNNVFIGQTNCYPIPCAIRFYTSSSAITSLTNFKVWNNVFADFDFDYWVIKFGSDGASPDWGNPSFSGVEFKNNSFINCGTTSSYDRIYKIDDSSAFTGSSFAFDYNLYWSATSPRYVWFRGTNQTLTAWLANEPHSRTNQPSLTSYGLHASGNDFHLLAGDTAAKDFGVSEAAAFTTDKDGVTRPQGSAWDIGPYEYSAGSTNAAGPVVTFGTMSGGGFSL